MLIKQFITNYLLATTLTTINTTTTTVLQLSPPLPITLLLPLPPLLPPKLSLPLPLPPPQLIPLLMMLRLAGDIVANSVILFSNRGETLSKLSANA